MKFKIFILLILLSGFILPSCKEKVNDFLGNDGPEFNMDLFEQGILDGVNFNGDQPKAWAYVINKDGLLARSGAFGNARTAADGQLPFDLNKEINVASITKFYTAIAVMQLLDANNLVLDDKISGWLPNSWTQGPGVSNLSFKDLLKHESGLNSINSNFDSTLGYSGLKSCIKDGVMNPKTRSYLNVNFALFRVLIPSLWDGLPGAPGTIDIESDANTRIMYLWYMQSKVWGPIGLTYILCAPEDRSEATLYYNVNDNNSSTPGVYYGDWTHRTGGGGHFMTPMEIARVNAYFENTNILLDEDSKQLMKDHRIGFDLSSGMEEHGKYYGKNGSISTSSGNQGVLGQIAIFPINGVEIVVIMNTQGVTLNGNNNFIGNMIYQAYNNAWED